MVVPFVLGGCSSLGERCEFVEPEEDELTLRYQPSPELEPGQTRPGSTLPSGWFELIFDSPEGRTECEIQSFGGTVRTECEGPLTVAARDEELQIFGKPTFVDLRLIVDGETQIHRRIEPDYDENCGVSRATVVLDWMPSQPALNEVNGAGEYGGRPLAETSEDCVRLADHYDCDVIIGCEWREGVLLVGPDGAGDARIEPERRVTPGPDPVSAYCTHQVGIYSLVSNCYVDHEAGTCWWLDEGYMPATTTEYPCDETCPLQ